MSRWRQGKKIRSIKNATLHQKIYVNLPVKDPARLIPFFKRLSFEFDPQSTNDHGACVVVGQNIYAMPLPEAFFKTFTAKPICDARQSAEVLVCISCENRSEVDALAAGGKAPRAPQDHGFMYRRGFEDLGWHIWEPIHMAPNAAGAV